MACVAALRIAVPLPGAARREGDGWLLPAAPRADCGTWAAGTDVEGTPLVEVEGAPEVAGPSAVDAGVCPRAGDSVADAAAPPP